MKRSHKATRQQLKQHNRQLLLRSIYEQPGCSRATLSEETGLAKPTVSDIVSELIEKGFVEETGQGSSTAGGGKRPTLLRFVPTAQQVIGISITDEAVIGCLANLDAAIVARHQLARSDLPLLTAIEYVIHALLAQCDAPLLCIGLGVPGVVDEDHGIVVASPALDWHNMPLSQTLSARYNTPVYVSNNTELAARAHIVYGNQRGTQNLAVLLINHTVEIGLTFAGKYRHGSDLRQLALANGLWVHALSHEQVLKRIQALLAQHSGSQLSATLPTYLYLRRAYLEGDAAAQQLVGELATLLAQIYTWIIGLTRPEEIVLAGQLSDTGQPLLDAVWHDLAARLPVPMLETVHLSLADRQQLTLRGAVVGALQRELGLF
jgi:predicted NBD/HSP70 family sugar kinase